ncbi:hypothetical protein [Rhizobium sp. BR 315]|uniref:hypothetical protein n=1 Tax=Rhizobium sp. BR 315 TaxID=3040014 RepID=UPI003D3303E4
MLLEEHEQVEVVMCDANHDPAGEVWLREMLAAFYEDEPRVAVDVNPAHTRSSSMATSRSSITMGTGAAPRTSIPSSSASSARSTAARA